VDEPLRRIVHIDMDAFYASVEQRDQPELRGRPVAVGGDPRGRGVVCAASYEARVFGVRSAIPMARAVRLCPQLIIVPPDFVRYRTVSNQVFSIFRRVTALVEPLSLDEAYLDVTENEWGEPLAGNVAKRIKAAIRDEVSLTASAGVAPNKFLAKVASGWKKPDGLTVVSPDRVESFLHQLPVDALWGVGPVTGRKLRDAGILRLVDVRSAEESRLRELLGNQTDWFRQLAWGRDQRRVEPDRPRKSVGSENTFPTDLVTLEEISREIKNLAGHCTAWLTRHHMFARTVTLKVRYADFMTITRSASENLAMADPAAIERVALGLLDRTDAGRRPVRLLGVSLHKLTLDPAPRRVPVGAALALPFPDPDGPAT
jgi:DNA polymerase-4